MEKDREPGCRRHGNHELNEVMEVSDRILVMYDGQLFDGGLHGEKTETDIGLLMTGGGCP